MRARILVIEDNEASLELMLYLLEAHGYSPLRARDGEEGLALIRSEQPDLILCDLHMPKLDGLEVGRLVKEDPKFRHLTLVAVTALAMVGDREKVLSAGFDGYMTKPIVPEKFMTEVERFLDATALSGQKPGGDRSIVPIPVPPVRKATILIIDDTSENLLLGSSIFLPHGYEVVQTADPAQAEMLAMRHNVDVVLTDMNMGGVNGADVLHALHGNPRLQHLPVLIVSSTFVGPRERASLMAAGARAVLSRPVDVQSLVAEVDACLRS